MGKRIIISVTSDLATDHRVQKVTSTLYESGYDVLLVGRRLKNSIPFHAKYPFKQFRLLFNRSFLFYAEYNIRLFFFLLFAKGDVFLSNDLDTLLANFCAAKLRRKHLVYDSHELFTEVPEVVDRHMVKGVWLGIERLCLPRVDGCYTVCDSIANYYNKKYGVDMHVVRNVPMSGTRHDVVSKLSFPGKRIVLYQGALNIGRGIEWVIDAMPLVKDAVLVIIGDGDISNALKLKVKSLQLEDKVFFLGRITCDELPSYTVAADLGLCLLANSSLSYYYSLPNRIFDYMYSYVPVLASDFPEIAQVVNDYHIGETIDMYNPEFLANRIENLLQKNWHKENFDVAMGKFCWENERKVLLDIFSKLEN